MKPCDIPYADAALLYAEAWNAGWALPPDLTVSEWADEHRILSTKGAGEPGPWRTSRTPYLKEIMDALSVNSPYEDVVFMAGAQVGKTECGNNWIGYVVDIEPGPMMVVQTTTNNAKKFSKQRINPLFQETPALNRKVAENRSRDDSNTTLMKDFPGGFLVISGANSAADLRSMPVRYLFADEVDGYPQDVDGEGDPLKLAVQRTNTFSLRKRFYCSTPTLKQTSRIDPLFLASDQRRYMVPCPECKHHQWLKFAGLKYDKQDLSTVHYACEECGSLIAEHQKTWMLENGYWEATNPNGQSGMAGFHLSSLYSPAGWLSWSAIARQWIDAVEKSTKGDFAALKTFINTILGETYDAEQDKVKSAEVKTLVSRYALRSIPRGVLVLTAGVDTQDNRLEVQLVGWSEGEKPWVIDYHVIHGDTSTHEPWDELTKYLETPLQNQFGQLMRIEATAIDAGGHRTHAVYNYCRMHKSRGVFAVRGAVQANKPIIGKPSKVDFSTSGKVVGGSADYWAVGTDTAKDLLMGKIKSSIEQGQEDLWNIVFSDQLPDEYFNQLTAECYDPNKRRWVKPAGRRNEALDTFVYAIAAAMHPRVRVHVMKPLDWARRKEIFEPVMGDLFNQAQAEPAAVKPAEKPMQNKTSQNPVESDSWLDGCEVNY